VSRNLKKGLILTIFVVICFITLLCKGYFSENVKTLIIVNAKKNSLNHIESIISEEVVANGYDFFYESVTEDGLVISSFDTNEANLLLANTMSKLKYISENFEENGSFNIDIPATYLFVPSSFLFTNLRLKVEVSNLMYYDVKLKTNIKEYGLNNSLVELWMTVDIKYQIYAPLMVSSIDNQIEVPLSVKVFNGRVPEGLFSYQNAG
jgi:hypothetical protein